jgi:hypothetical protein
MHLPFQAQPQLMSVNTYILLIVRQQYYCVSAVEASDRYPYLVQRPNMFHHPYPVPESTFRPTNRPLTLKSV